MNFLKKNSWTIDLAKIPSYVEWNGDWKYAIDKEIIRLILECNELDEFGNQKITETMKTHFKNNIVDKLKDGVLHIEWTARCGNLGRRYSSKDPTDPDPFSSAGNLGVHSKYIKNTIFCYQNWIDYDMVKGHPTLLLSMAKHTNMTGGILAVERYVNEFENSLADEMIEWYSIKTGNLVEDAKNKITKADIKDLHNRTIYGGGHSKWVEKIEKGDSKKGKLPRPCNHTQHFKYAEFFNDIQRVINLVYESNPDLVSKVANTSGLEEWRKKNRTMSYYCGILENECLKHAYKYGIENGLFKARTIDLCYDGFTAPAPPSNTDMDFHINSMNNYILEKTGFAIKMKVKGFDNKIHSILEARQQHVKNVNDDKIEIPNYELNELFEDMVNSQTEQDIATYFVSLYGYKFKCVSLEGKGTYYYFNGSIWEETGTTPIREMISNEFRTVISKQFKALNEFIPTITNENNKAFYTKKSKIIGEIIIRLGKTNDKNNITKEITDKIVDYDFAKKLDVNIGKLAFKNGIMDLETGIFTYSFKADDYISSTIPHNYITFYDKKKYQKLKQILKHILNNNETHLEYMLSAIGHCFTGMAYKEKSIYFCVDKTNFACGDNGKTFIFDILTHLLPNYVYKTKSSFLEENNKKLHKQLVMMKGKRLVWMDEYSRNKINSELLKEVADGLTSENEVMFGTSETIDILFKMFVLTNNLPNIDPRDTAVYNRYKQISYGSHFDRTGTRTEIDEEKLLFIADTSLGDLIKNEYYNEFLHMIVNYAHKFYKNNLKLPTIPSEFLKDAIETKKKNDDFGIWFDDNCEIKEGHNISLKEMVLKSGLPEKKIKEGMERLRFKYDKDLSKGMNKNPLTNKQYKGGFAGCCFSESETIEEE